MVNAQEQKVYDVLNLLNIKFMRYEHKAVYTVEEANELDICIIGQHCKNLFLRNRKGDVYYLVILDDTKKVDLKSLSQQIGSSNLSFASEERLNKCLGLKPGSVTPFGIINDVNREVTVLVDRDLIKADIVNFHPNVNTTTIGVSYQDLEKFIRWHDNKIKYVEV